MRIEYLKRFILSLFREKQKNLFTQIPGYVLAFDPSTQLAQVQIGIVGTDEDGTFNHSPIIQCPVHFSGGADWSTEHKIESGDEGMIYFSQRCADAWLQTGGVAQNPIMRFHDKQDAFLLPGFRSKPNAISDFQNNGVRLRNSDASFYAWLKDDGTIELSNGSGYITLSSSGEVDINGFIISVDGAAESPVSVTAPAIIGTTSVTAPTVSAATSLTVNGVEQSEHTHTVSGITTGSQSVESDPPTE